MHLVDMPRLWQVKLDYDEMISILPPILTKLQLIAVDGIQSIHLRGFRGLFSLALFNLIY